VAPKHVRFKVSGKDVYIQHIDMNKGAKTFVNEQPVKTEQLLKYEDVIQIGSAKLFFKTE
jgi:pSer/pThr/pTyr-binding forkhead associated (FHA) protein